jgi:hypothetical protein
MAKIAEHSQLADKGEVPEVAQQPVPECYPLFAHLLMPVLRHHSAVRLRVRRKWSAAVFCYHPKSLVGYGPVVGGARQVEGLGPGARIAVIVRATSNTSGSVLGSKSAGSSPDEASGRISLTVLAKLQRIAGHHLQTRTEDQVISKTNENSAAGEHLGVKLLKLACE